MMELYVLRTAVPVLLIVTLIIWYKRYWSGGSSSQVKNLEVRGEMSERASADAVMESEPDDAWLARLREIITENLVSPHFNVDHLAELMNVSRTALYRMVHEKAKQSPNQLIQELRLQQAHQLLESGQYDNLYQVADAVGFRSADYFSRLYRARFGKSPAEFVKKAGINM
jgi:transcriptional regulator GlxA family with amidase domain